MIPVSFAGCAGFLHEASGDCVVVMAGAVGYEHLCAHRAWRELGERLADAGYPALRFDWAGCGDSLGDDQDPGRCDAWEASLRDALAFARDELGADRIVVVGLRLGALIAADVSAMSPDVDGVVLMAPPANGRLYGRELAALSKVIGTRPPPAGLEGIAPGDLEVAGFLLTAETRAALERYDLKQLKRRPAGRILLVAQAGHASAPAIADHLRALDAEVDEATFTGYSELLTEPTFSRTPHAAFNEVVAWIKQTFPVTIGRPVARYLPPARLHDRGFTETTLVFEGDGPLVGVWCRPTSAARDAAVLFVNAGANPHGGWARMSVDFARSLALQGIASLRMDVAGLGDSPPVAGRAARVMYDDAPRQDVRAALALMEAAGHGNIHVMGLCSGAHLAFHTAVEDARVTGFVLVNLQKFVWRSTDSFDIAVRQAYRSNGFYKAGLRRAETWMRLMRGEIDVRGIAGAVARRMVRSLATRLAAAGRRLQLVDDDTAKVQRWFRTLAARGIRGLVVLSAEDGGVDELALHMGAGGRGLLRLPGMELAIIEGADHNVTPRWARLQLLQLLQQHVAPDANALEQPLQEAAQ